MWTSLEFYRQVLAGTPKWVWLVLLALIVLGARQLRDRVVPSWTVLIAPIVFMVIGVVGSRRSGLALATWAAVACVACALAWRFLPRAKGARFDAETKRLYLPGGVSAGAWMIVTFLVTYFINVLFAVYPQSAKETRMFVIASSIMGALMGAFFGRALKQFLLR
jgi:hypothetical protein